MNSSIGEARAVLVNRLAKRLHIYNSLKYALTERHVAWGEAGRNHYFLLLSTPKLCPKVAGEALPNRALVLVVTVKGDWFLVSPESLEHITKSFFCKLIFYIIVQKTFE
jgi:hypothetical protein